MRNLVRQRQTLRQVVMPQPYNLILRKLQRGIGMFYTVLGVALIVVSCGSFWYLLPRKGKTHPYVANSDAASMITIVIMTVLTAGLGFLGAGLFG